MPVTTEETIIAEGQLQFSEFLRFSYLQLWRRAKLLILLVCFVSFVYVPLSLFGAFGQAGKAAEGKEFGYFIPPAVLASLLLMPYFAGKRSFAANKQLTQHVRFSFSADGIDVVGPLSSGTCKWEGIVTAIESKFLLLLYPTKEMAYIVPKRYFRSPSALAQFRELLDAQLGERAKLHLNDRRDR